MKTSSSKVVKTETTVEFDYNDILNFVYSKYPELKKFEFKYGAAKWCPDGEFGQESSIELNFEQNIYD